MYFPIDDILNNTIFGISNDTSAENNLDAESVSDKDETLENNLSLSDVLL